MAATTNIETTGGQAGTVVIDEKTFNEKALAALAEIASEGKIPELAQKAIEEAKAVDFTQATYFLKPIKSGTENILGELEIPEKILCLAAINLLRDYKVDNNHNSYDLITASRFLKDALRKRIIKRFKLTSERNFEIEFRKGWVAVKHGRLFDHI